MRKRILIWVFVALLLNSAALTAVLQWRSAGAAQQTYDTELIALQGLVRSGIETGLIYGFPEIVSSTLKNLDERPMFLGGVIFDEDLTDITTFPDGFSIPPEAMAALTEIYDDGDVSATRSVRLGDNGYALSVISDGDNEVLAFSVLAFTREDLIASNQRALGISVVFAMLTALTSLAFIWRKLSDIIFPLSIITTAIERVVSGAGDQPVLIEGAVHEIGQLSRSFAVMQDHLNEYHGKLNAEIVERQQKEDLLAQALEEADHNMNEAIDSKSRMEKVAVENIHLLEDLSISEQDARQKSTFIKAVLDNIGQGVTVWDENQNLVAWNAPALGLFDLPQSLMQEGLNFQELIQFLADRGEPWESTPGKLVASMIRDTAIAANAVNEWDQERPDGSVINIRRRILEDGSVISTQTDVTAERLREEKTLQLSLRDPLTGLGNRRAFGIEIDKAIRLADSADTGVVLACIDLDNFKIVNDVHGHAAGDAALEFVSRVMKDNIRNTDIAIRMGGDEFAIIFNDTTNVDLVKRSIENIIEKIRSKTKVAGYTINIGASAGLSSYPCDATTPEILLNMADEALYEAKNAGKGQVAICAA